MRIVIRDVLTVTMNDKGEIEVFTILIEGSRITALLKGKEFERLNTGHADVVIHGAGKIALPCFINGHIHSDVTLARGLGDGLTLYEQDSDSFVSRKKWFYDELDREARYYSKLLQYMEAVKGGIGFICDVPFWFYGDEIIEPFKKVGIQGAVVLDYRKNFLTGEPIEKKKYFRTAHLLSEAGILPIVEGPSEEHFDEELLKFIGNTAAELDTFVQMHLAETTWRVDIIKNRFGLTPVRYLDRIGFLRSNVIGSHGIYIDGEELGIIKKRGVRIINCPVSEMKISDGTAPVSAFIKKGIPLGIGTDGALWNDSCDMFSEMKSLMLLQRVTKGANALDAYSCLYAATRGGALVFGKERELGSLEQGKKASITLIDYMKPHLVPLYHGTRSNILQNIVSCARASDVDTVIVEGNIVVQGGKIRTLDETDIIQKCQELGNAKFKHLS